MTEFGPRAPRRRAQSNDIQTLIHQMDMWSRARNGMTEWAEIAKQCVDFAEGRQYSEEDIAALEEANIPALTLNKIAPLLRLMFGFYRANEYQIRYKAGADGTGTDTVADVLTALSKHIDADNRTKWLDAEVWDDGLTTGRGYWDTRLDFRTNIFGEIRERVLDPFSVNPDPEGDSYDPETWNHVHVSRWASLDDIELIYGQPASEAVRELQDGSMPVINTEGDPGLLGDISPMRFFGGSDPFNQDFGMMSFGSASVAATDLINRHRKLIRVIETQHRKLKKVNRFIDLRTGQIRVIPDFWKRERVQGVLQWAQQHQAPIIVDQAMMKCIRWTVSAGNMVLYDDWSPYRMFTVVPYFAQFRRGSTRGMVKDLVGPQQEINKRRSALLQVLMSVADSGWIVEENSLTNESQRALEQQGGAPGLILTHKQGSNPPQRIDPAAVPNGMVVAEDRATNDLMQIAGVNESAMGQDEKVTSGRAVEARQRSAYLGAELYFANFARSQELKGRLRLSIIQDYYTEPRLYRVPGDDGKDQVIQLNWQQASEEVLNDITSGTYHTTIDTAPVSATFMQAAFEEALELQKAGVPISPQRLLQMSSLPMKDKIAEEASQQPPAPPPPQAVAAQAAAKRAADAIPLQQLKNQSAAAVADANNQSDQTIADKRVALEQNLEQQQIAQKDRAAANQLALAQHETQGAVHALSAVRAPGAAIADELQRNADVAFAKGNISASNAALQTLDRMLAPPAAAQARATYSVLPGAASE